jgi:hypothetical protein
MSHERQIAMPPAIAEDKVAGTTPAQADSHPAPPILAPRPARSSTTLSDDADHDTMPEFVECPPPPPPLLDLPEEWAALNASEDASAASARADSIADELTFYLVAPREGGTMQRMARDEHGILKPEFQFFDVKVDSDDAAASSFEDGEESINEDEGKEDADDDDEDTPSIPPSVFGEPLTLALACEDKLAKKSVPPMTHDAITTLVAETAAHLSDISDEHVRLAIADAITMKLVSPLFCILVEAAETRLTPLRESTRAIIAFAAEHANPREFYIMLKSALSRVSESYIKQVFPLVVDDLVVFWTAAVPRISGKRALFLKDITAAIDQAYFDNDGRDATVYDDPADAPDQLKRDTAVAKFVRTMLLVQVAQKSKGRDDDGVLEVEKEAQESGKPTAKVSPQGQREKPLRKSAHMLAKEALSAARTVAEDKERDVHDFLTECGTTLAMLFKVVETAMNRMPMPEVNVSLPSGRAGKRTGRNKSRRAMLAERTRLEEFLVSTRELFVLAGFDNPVDACQQTIQLLSLSPLNADSSFSGCVAYPKPLRKRKLETIFSSRSLACYLILSLNLPESGGESGRDAKTAIDRSAFALLDPIYALELVQPLLMIAVGDPNPVMSLAGIELTSAFVDATPDGFVNTMSHVTDSLYGTQFVQTDASLYGLASLIALATGRMDNPEHRGLAYETLQSVLHKIGCPRVRFGVILILVLQADRAAMSAQLITELKDCLRAIDTADLSKKFSEEFRTRFTELCLPRYLLPRKEILAGLNPAIATSNAGLFIAISDSNRAASLEEGWAGKDENLELHSRMMLTRTYLKLGREAMRAIASVSEHDMKSIPESKLAKRSEFEAQSLFGAASRTLNDCVASITSLDCAIDKLSGVLRD